MKIYRIMLAALATATLFCAVSCNKTNGSNNELSGKSFFSAETFHYNLTQNPVINIPVVRLGNSGDLNVTISATGSSQFTVPTSATIKDGERMADLEVTYDKSALTFNEVYNLTVTIGSYDSIYGYETANVVIEYPTSFYEYGNGTIYEGWWGEQEDKTLYVRDYAENVLQCYLPQCWGHDSGGPEHYDVQDYVFYWNTKTNMLYIPLQYMGCEDWNIADRGAIACMFGGPKHKEGSADWMKYIDDWYTKEGLSHPHYDPERKSFYLSDSAAVSPKTGEVVYGTAGDPDVYTLE